MDALTKKLLKAFRPSLFGDRTKKELQERLEEYLCEADKKLTGTTLTGEDKATAREVWTRYRAYADAYDNVMGRAEQVSVNSEGSVVFGDRAALLRELAKSRNNWRDIWNALVTPETPSSSTGRGLGTMALPTDYVF